MTSLNLKKYEIRCPVYGFVVLNEWEMHVVNNPFFQRLRRIRQLGWTHYIYPGAMHTRFEHSLGVMHMAGLIFDAITAEGSESRNQIENMYGRKHENFPSKIYRQLVRFAALLHDVGHAPFSHAGEELFPYKDKVSGEKYDHEGYSAAIVRHYFKESIESYVLKLEEKLKSENDTRNSSLSTPKGDDLETIEQMKKVTAERVASLIERSLSVHKVDGVFRDIISGQLDADRMDYLLRDAHHTGVAYGNYDWRRLLHTLCCVTANEDGALGVEYGGHRDAEGLLLSRHAMFRQVYFHKTRIACDNLYQSVLQSILPKKGIFPEPTKKGLKAYLHWDDDKVLEKMAKEAHKAANKKKKGNPRDKGEEACRRLYERDPLRLARFYALRRDNKSKKSGSKEEEMKAYLESKMHDFLLEKGTDEHTVQYQFCVVLIERAWYKGGIPVVMDMRNREGSAKQVNLDEISPIVRSLRMEPTRELRVYVDKEYKREVAERLDGLKSDIKKQFPQLIV